MAYRIPAPHLVSFLLLSGLLLAPCAGGAVSPQLPSGHPRVESLAADQAIPPVPEDAGTGSTGLVWTPPGAWVEETPASSMRRAQYRIAGEAGDGECVVYYFGPGQGGDAQSNAERWAYQFVQPDGSSPIDKMILEQRTVGEVEVTTVEVTGTYAGGMLPGRSQPEPLEDAMLLGAIAAGPDANWFFKCTGPQQTLRPQKEEFAAMIGSLRRGE